MLLEVICFSIVIAISYLTCFLCQVKYCFLMIKYSFHDFFNIWNNKTNLPSKSGKVAIVTGGSRGIGSEVVKKLLQCDMEVIIACRTPSAGEKLIHEIRKSGITSGQAKVYKLDNSSLESVRDFAKQIKTDYDKIHILINNAGILLPPASNRTKDGYEEQWGINYLSHFLLTSLLLPLLHTGGHPDECSRIINVTSCAHDFGIIDFDHNSSEDKFCTHASYSRSKLAMTMFTIILQRLLKDKSLNVLVYSVHPGLVKTDIFNSSALACAFSPFLNLIWKTPDQGAIPIVYAAVNKNIENKGGIYISNCKEIAVSSSALNEKDQERLFVLSLKQVHLKDFFQYL